MNLRKPALALSLILLTLLAIGNTPGAAARKEAPPQPAHPLGPSAPGMPIPSTGNQKMLVILADFPDKAGLFTGAAWQSYFFGQGAGSFNDYFEEVSYGNLSYTGDIVALSGGAPVVNGATVAYVRLPNPITYYADGMYGFKIGAGQFPKNNGGVVHHALQALDAAGFDFSPYANPGTSEVDNLTVVFAGATYAEAQDPVNSLEATAYRLEYAGLAGGYTSSGGVLFQNYTFCPDQRDISQAMAYIGVCAHEHGHGMGLPDHYDFSYTTSGNGYFEIMAYGTFGATGGMRPFHFGTYNKARLGWMSFSEYAHIGPITTTLQPIETYANAIKLYPNGNPASPEYFLLENRQPLGFEQDWAGVGLCPGLVIWHIDQDVIDAHSFTNTINTLPSAGGPAHQGAVVVEADGGFDMLSPPLNYGDCADTWKAGQTWDAGSTPSSALWDGSPTGLSVTVVSENADGSLTLSITADSIYMSGYIIIDPPHKIYLPITVR